MFEIATFTYAALASFVLASITNNRRENRVTPRIVTLFGWGLMAFSSTLSLLLSGWLLWKTMLGGFDF